MAINMVKLTFKLCLHFDDIPVKFSDCIKKKKKKMWTTHILIEWRATPYIWPPHSDHVQLPSSNLAFILIFNTNLLNFVTNRICYVSLQ